VFRPIEQTTATLIDKLAAPPKFPAMTDNNLPQPGLDHQRTGNASSSTPSTTPAHTLPLGHAYQLGWKDNDTSRTLDQKAADRNPVLAEQLVRAYYAVYGVCPPLFPSGLRLERGGHDEDELPEFWADDVSASRLYRYSHKKKGDNKWAWIRGAEGDTTRTARLATYDSAMRTDESTAITTLWDDQQRVEESSDEEDDKDDEPRPRKDKARHLL
jgi:hypothetical protein